MTYSTLEEIKTKLQYDDDIFDEDFINTTTELLGYINEAIDDVEAEIHSNYEDYFLVPTTLTLASGTKDYSLPSDIFATKIRALHYDNGSKYYEIKKIKRLTQVLNYRTGSTENYRFLIINPSTGLRVRLYPTPLEAGAYVQLWYIRNAKRLALDADACDIPEFINFIYAHVKYNLAFKEKLPWDVGVLEKKLEVQRGLMIKTLATMTPDESSNEIPPDLSFYEDFDADFCD